METDHAIAQRRADSAVKVLYIAGMGRSGSTILGNILGEIDGVFCAGEMVKLWHQILHNDRCGCGAHVTDCPAWRSILGSWMEAPPEQLSWLDGFWDSPSQDLWVSLQLAMRPAQVGAPALHPAVLSATRDVYRRIADVTGARIIVDTSKSPGLAQILSQVPELDLYVLHLVRDPRGLTYSLLRDYERQRGEWTSQPTWRRIPWIAGKAAQWDLYTLAFHRAWRRMSWRYFFLRYEDFAEAPAGSVAAILRLLGESPSASPFDDGGRSLTLGVNHTISGHPNRHRSGETTVRPDDQWQSQMRPEFSRGIAVMTQPVRTYLDSRAPSLTPQPQATARLAS